MVRREVKLFPARVLNAPEFCSAVFCVRQGRILEHRVITLSVAMIAFIQQEDELLTHKPLLLEPCFSAV